ncbi:MAG: hypothetical protein AAGI24_09315 [Pseudomonadota bacterium]
MDALLKSKFFTLINRELQEYRGSLVVTPAVIGSIFIVLMLLSILLAGRFLNFGGNVIEIFTGEASERSVSIDLSISEDQTAAMPMAVVTVDAEDVGPVTPLTITKPEEELSEEAWNFSREWTFSAPSRDASGDDMSADDGVESGFVVLHSLFLLAMFFVSGNYLLGCLFDDRKDRSILFWKSMPVSEREEVVSKLATAAVATPLIFLLLSWLTQLLVLLLASVLMWRMELNMPDLWSEFSLLALFGNQLVGMVISMLFLVPLYAWLMLASAAAKRSPFLWAAAIPIGLMLAEQVVFGTTYLATMAYHHFPHAVDGDNASSLGFYGPAGPVLAGADYVGMGLGIAVGAGFLLAAGWMRRHRFEI